MNKPAKDEPELLWGLYFLPALAVIAAVLVHLPSQLLPDCRFYEWSGLPCPGCGVSRALRHLLRGDIIAALRLQPLAILVCAAAAGYSLYSAIVVFGRLPRRRWNPDRRTRIILLLLAMGAMLINWAYLLQSSI